MASSNSIIADIGKADNLHDSEPIMNRKSVILGITISFLIISSLGATGRLYIRTLITRNLGLDDLFVCLSVFLNFAAAIALFLLTSKGGLGQHFILLGVNGMQEFLKIFYVANALYNVSTTLIKLALLFQYLRILPNGSILRKISILFIVIVSIWGATFIILAWVPCLPVYAFWEFTIPESSVKRYAYGSHDENTIVTTFLAHSASNVSLDVIIFAIPVPLWIRSNPERKTRLALQGLFVLGAIVNVCSIVRLISLVENRAATFPTYDPTWYGSAPIVLAALEAYVATLCASLPVFWPIVKDVLGTKKILVTHEVVIKTEARTDESVDTTSAYNATSPSTRFSKTPWERVGDKYRETRAFLP